MDPMEFSIELPVMVEVSSVGHEWYNMKQRLSSHLQHGSDVARHSQQSLVTAFLINIASEHVQQVFNSFGLSFEEALKFSQVLHTLEEVCLPRLLIMYNRYRFFTCKQSVGRKFDDFLQELLRWSENCEFGDLRDILLKDCIISGIFDDSVRQHLLRTEGLDLRKTLAICEAMNQRHFTRETAVNTDKDTSVAMFDASVDTVDLVLSTSLKDNHSNTDTIECANVSTEVTSDLLEIKMDHIEDDVSSPILPTPYSDPLIEKELSGIVLKDIPTEEIRMDSNGSMNYDRNKLKVQSNKLTLSASNTSVICEETRTLRKSKRIKKGTSLSRENLTCEAEELKEIDSVIKAQEDTGIKCPFCLSSFPDPKSVRQHVVKSHGKPFCYCKICKCLFEDSITLSKHKLTHDIEKKFKCDTCVAAFKSKHHLATHLRLHTGERPFTCDVCAAAFNEASKLKAHMRKHSGEHPYACDVCQRTFAWSAALLRHKRTHTGEQPYTCETCGQSFADLSSLQRHRRKHTNERPFSCQTCSAKFNDRSAMKVHQRIHTGERPFSCPICGSAFARSGHLKEHIKIHSGTKPFSCTSCNAKFTEASKLKCHMRKHTGEKPYQCKECGMAFAWSAAFRRHIRRHTKEKPYFCDFCGSRFADHATLTRHRRTHTGERPYPCSLCTATFADNSSLHRHLRIHTGEKSYVCDVCAASFSVKTYLDRHMRTHSREKSYICDICAASFSVKAYLDRHMRRHAGVKPYSCQHCWSRFPDITKLKRHMKIHMPSSDAKLLDNVVPPHSQTGQAEIPQHNNIKAVGSMLSLGGYPGTQIPGPPVGGQSLAPVPSQSQQLPEVINPPDLAYCHSDITDEVGHLDYQVLGGSGVSLGQPEHYDYAHLEPASLLHDVPSGHAMQTGPGPDVCGSI